MGVADPAEARVALSERGWLPLCPPAFREAVLARSHIRSYERGDPLYRLDDPPGGLFGLASGGIALEIAPGMRSPYIAHFMRPGMWFGASAMLTGQRRKVGILATRPSVALHLSAADFAVIAAQDREAWRWLSLVLVLNNDLALAVCDDLMIREPKERATAILLRLAGCRSADAGQVSPADVDVTQDELAVMTNLSRTTVGGLLRDYERAGWISQSYRRITILDVRSLQSVSAVR